MRIVALLFLGLFFAGPLRAACTGQNLIAALPPGQRAELVQAADAVPFSKGNLWRAIRQGQEITLVGTYHLDDPRHDVTIARLESALDAATTLLVEAGPAEEAALRAHIAAHPERLQNTSGPSLAQALRAPDWLRLSDALIKRGVKPLFAARLQPWFLSSLLAVPTCQLGDASKVNGLDRRLMNMAGGRGLPVQALEPYDTIFSIFDSFSAEDQLAMLLQTLDTDSVNDDMAVTVSDSYFNGQSRQFWELTRLQQMTLSGATQAEADRQIQMVEEALLTRRNLAWVPVMTRAAANGPVVAAFGALHLSGEHGVLNLLVRQGWDVLPLTP
jgi:uncharacterized protein YbaP (TraB family)